MTSGAEHYAAAERLLGAAVLDDEVLADVDRMLAAAQVHATLALAAITAAVAESQGMGITGYGGH